MEFAIFAGGIFFLAGLIKGIVGFGFPLIALVLLTLSIGLLDALALIVIPTFVTNLWQGLSGGRLVIRPPDRCKIVKRFTRLLSAPSTV